jgi:hypothetical protein
LLKTKKYALTIAVLNPYVLAGIAVTYLTNGRFELAKNAPVIPVIEQEQLLSGVKNETHVASVEAPEQ